MLPCVLCARYDFYREKDKSEQCTHVANSDKSYNFKGHLSHNTQMIFEN